jgi:hypothetical protein
MHLRTQPELIDRELVSGISKPDKIRFIRAWLAGFAPQSLLRQFILSLSICSLV